MKTISLRIGDKKSKREAVKVPLSIAENATDMLTLAKGSEAVVTRCFNRGYRIENQERSGARDAFKEGKTESEIATIVSTYDPTTSQPRSSGPRKPKTIALVKGKKSYSADDLKALLAANGIQVEESEPATEAAPPALAAK